MSAHPAPTITAARELVVSAPAPMYPATNDRGIAATNNAMTPAFGCHQVRVARSPMSAANPSGTAVIPAATSLQVAPMAAHASLIVPGIGSSAPPARAGAPSNRPLRTSPATTANPVHHKAVAPKVNRGESSVASRSARRSSLSRARRCRSSAGDTNSRDPPIGFVRMARNARRARPTAPMSTTPVTVPLHSANGLERF